MEVDYLKQIVKNTEHKTSFQIIVSDNESSFNPRLNPTLELDRDKEYEIALVNLKTYYSFQTSMKPTMCSFIPQTTVIRG